VDELTEFDKNRGAIFGRRGLAAAVRSEAEDERPSPAASNLTLSAKKLHILATGEVLNCRFAPGFALRLASSARWPATIITPAARSHGHAYHEAQHRRQREPRRLARAL
jgi:hypothetical protein